MRILYCIPHLYNSGGMERVLTQKVNWLAAHTEHEITIITTEPVPAGASECYFPLSEKVKVVNLNIDFNTDYTKPLLTKYYAHMRRMRAYRCALTEYIRAKKIDLCISLCGKEIAFLRHLPCRTIAEMHFAKDQRHLLLMANHKGPFWSLLGRVRTWQLVRAVKPLEKLVVLTEADKREWEESGCRNVTVIPNPCALSDAQCTIHNAQCTMHNAQKAKTVLAVGRLHEQKGFDLLLQAWDKVQRDKVQSTKDWTLRIVGEGPKRAELEAQMKSLQLQHIILVGRAENVADEYSEASLFVLSSRYEGLPLALIEAMWCGVPCIAFDCPQGPAELLADGRGWLVPANDVEKLAEQILYVIAHPDEAQERATKAQAYAQATYSEEVIMPRWEKVIDKE